MESGLKKLVVVIVVSAVISGSAWAQQTSGIAGVARDASRALIPGVTVEASSPALIERVRTAVTDEQGRYNIVDLRPGTYRVSFTLPGFTTFRRDGIARLDLRLSKVVKIAERTRVQVNVDLYNALNASSILSLVPGGAVGGGIASSGGTVISYSPTWRRPTDILEGRILQFSSQLRF